MKRVGLVVVQNKTGQLLVLRRSGTAKWMPLRWALPGGHIKAGEKSKTGALRELYEETNIRGKNPKLLEHQNGTSVWLVTDWIGAVDLSKASHGFEHNGWKWLYPEEVLLDSRVVPSLRSWDLLMRL